MAIIEKRNASTQIVDYILGQIIRGKLKKGDKIINEREFAEELGVSRVPLREAISALSLIGILLPKQGEGTFVNGYNPEIFGRAIYATVIMEDTSIDEIMRVRCMIESNAAELATSAATAEDLAVIESAKIAHAEAVRGYLDGKTSFETIIETDDTFHASIAAATHNTFFKQFFEALKYSIRYCMTSCMNQTDTFESFITEHDMIFQAIQKKQGAAAYIAMHDHVSDYTTNDSVSTQAQIANGFCEYQDRKKTAEQSTK